MDLPHHPTDTEKTVLVPRGAREGAPLQPAPASLVLIDGPQDSIGRQWLLDDGEAIIGRAMTSHVFIDDRSVSRAHTRLAVVREGVLITDLQSANRTEVNDRALPPLQPVWLEDGDRIRVGTAVFRFHGRGSLDARAVAILREQSERDPLTHAYNKRALALHGAQAVRRARHAGEPLSVAVLDIDLFKRINDDPALGHSGGDHVLREVARVVSAQLTRSYDLLARFGGEEFVVVLVDSDATHAARVAERIREAVAGTPIDYGDRRLHVTVSIGVASLGGCRTEWEHLFQAADAAMYAAKDAGRNQVRVAA
jgi:two-component system cell cycle response regulator